MMRNLHSSTRMGLGASLALLLLSVPGAARAVTIGLSATDGAAPAVTITVSGIEALAEPSLGAYDLDLFFDDSVLAFSSVEFGPFLGGPDDSLQTSGVSGGVVDFAEVSLLFPNFLLQSLQPDSFVLATVNFEALATEETLTTVGISQAILSDGNAASIGVDPIANVDLLASAIPEVGGAHVYALGLLVVGAGAWLSPTGRARRAALRTGS